MTVTAASRSHYDVLGISRDADAQQVRAAWKLHVQAWHPDRFTGTMRDEAERQASRINEAYTVLRDSGRRAAYDCSLAAEERAARPEPATAPRASSKIRPAAPRASAAPVGSPMPAPEPRTMGEQAAVIAADALATLKRHPRLVAAVAAVWVLIIGGSAIANVVAGPSLPSGAATAAAATHSPSRSARVQGSEQAEDLAALASRAQAENAAAEAELQQQLQEQARLDALQDAADQRAAAAAARAAALAAKKSGGAKGTAGAAPRTGRVVRVMPQAAPTA